MRKIAAFLMVALICVEAWMASGCSAGQQGEVQIVGGNGETITVLQAISEGHDELAAEDRRAYLDAVLTESEAIIAAQQGCSIEKARRYLLKNACTLYTAYDETVFSSVKTAYEEYGVKNLSFGCAVTDLHGNLLALYSAGKDEANYVNYATQHTPPYSSFKPLCVYAPAIENGLAVWSSPYLDAPIKKIATETGQTSDWPANATGTYTNENTSIADGLKTSLNTVAVRCMQTVGVSNALAFLESKFDLTLQFEKQKLNAYGEDEVIGNVALGYLYDGISPADMAGYYQVFANGGKYTKPHTVVKICDTNGEILYESQSEETQALTPSTAYLMNRMLQGVVTAGGTGAAAQCDGVPVGGKTGTGDDGNWFVGFTPQYSCAVWHGTEVPQNAACEIFSAAVSGFDHTKKGSFPTCAGIKEAVYCAESGMLFSMQCRKAERGYYTSETVPEVCTIHN